MKDLLVSLGALIAAVIILSAVQLLSGMMYPPPLGLDLTNKVELARWMGSLPIGALLMVLLSYALGSFAAGWIIGKFASNRHALRAGILGGLLMVFGFANLMSIAHPLWFSIVSTLIYIPMALLGERIGRGGKK